jgi:hypothetical protein
MHTIRYTGGLPTSLILLGEMILLLIHSLFRPTPLLAHLHPHATLTLALDVPQVTENLMAAGVVNQPQQRKTLST